jgi:hypothetical protein
LTGYEPGLTGEEKCGQSGYIFNSADPADRMLLVVLSRKMHLLSGGFFLQFADIDPAGKNCIYSCCFLSFEVLLIHLSIKLPENY